jgi:chemotaxis protein CheZ
MATRRRPFTAELRRGLRGGAGPSPDAGGDTGDGVPNPDTVAILAAIGGLSDRIGALETRVEEITPAQPPAPEVGEDGLTDAVRQQVEDARVMRTEIVALARSIEDTKAELAKLRDQRADGDRLTVMAHELDAIVEATEGATNGILDIAEAVSNQITEIQAQEKDSYIRHLADEVQEKLLGIFEHCNFQDLTGQRISKVVNTMKFIEDRIDRMMDIWGREGFVLAEEDETTGTSQDDRDRQLLNGPQTGNKGISQDEIDALFD